MKACLATTVLVLGLLALPALAHADTLTWTLTDGFDGGTAVQKNGSGTISNAPGSAGDVIGTDADFDLTTMEISYETTTGTLKVTLTGGYFDNIGTGGTSLGDLFLSTDGWSPYGSAANRYQADTGITGATQGEDWELVLAMNAADRTATDATSTNKKDVTVYNVADGSITDSDSGNNTIFRDGQEVSFTPDNGATTVATGNWWIVSQAGYDALHYEVTGLTNLFPTTAGDGLGVHWTMSCGNDVFEGLASNPVPEPGTMALVALAILGLGVVRRRRWMRRA